jgi:hypothetical protein
VWPVPHFHYGAIKRLFRGVLMANNGFDKQSANQAIAEGIDGSIIFFIWGDSNNVRGFSLYRNRQFVRCRMESFAQPP